MTQRELQPQPGVVKTGVYDTPGERHTAQTYREDRDVIVTTPTDLIRWGPVIAGFLAAMATLITLSVLGLAIGAATVDGTNQNLGLGSGIWAAIAALIAFFIGGLLAARTAAVGGHSNGILNGAMVWFLTIPLLVFLLSSGVSAFISTAAQAVAPVAGEAIGNVQVPGQPIQAPDVTPPQVTPEQLEQAGDTVSRGAWGTLLSLGLTAAAAIAGGYVGSRSPLPRTTTREARA